MYRVNSMTAPLVPWHCYRRGNKYSTGSLLESRNATWKENPFRTWRDLLRDRVPGHLSVGGAGSRGRDLPGLSVRLDIPNGVPTPASGFRSCNGLPARWEFVPGQEVCQDERGPLDSWRVACCGLAPRRQREIIQGYDSTNWCSRRHRCRGIPGVWCCGRRVGCLLCIRFQSPAAQLNWRPASSSGSIVEGADRRITAGGGRTRASKALSDGVLRQVPFPPETGRRSRQRCSCTEITLMRAWQFAARGNARFSHRRGLRVPVFPGAAVSLVSRSGVWLPALPARTSPPPRCRQTGSVVGPTAHRAKDASCSTILN